MRWFEYKMEVDDLHAPDDLKARLLAMQAAQPQNEQPEEKQPEAPTLTVQPGGAKPAWSDRLRVFMPRGHLGRIAAGIACAMVLFVGGSALLQPRGSYSLYSADAGMAKESPAMPEYAMTYDMVESESINGFDVEAASPARRMKTDGAGGDSAVLDPSATQRKIIYTCYLSLESKQYDETRAALEAAVAEAGGYISSCDEYSYSSTNRSVNLVLRIPQQNYSSFLEAAAGTGNLRSRSEQTEDVTGQYMDIAARIETMQARRTRLLELQAAAENMTELLEIEQALSDVQYQLESWQRQMMYYDDRIDYCTVTVNLSEVRDYTPVQASFGERMVNAFGVGWSDFVDNVQDFFLDVAFDWPLILLLACGIAAFFVWRRRRKRGKKNEGTSDLIRGS